MWTGPSFVAQKSQVKILIVAKETAPTSRIALLRREPSLPHTPNLVRFGGAFLWSRRDTNPLTQICAGVDYLNGLQENLKDTASEELRTELMMHWLG
jgi:hypothetical protein